MSTEAADLWRQRGHLLRQLKQPQLAHHSFEQALAIEPEHGPTLSAQGTVLAMLGQRQAALDYCDRGLLAPSADGFNARGLVHLIFRQFPQAIADFDQAIALDPGFSKAWHNRGIALARLGKDKDALDSAERSLALNPQPAVQALAAYLLLKRGQFRGAIAHCENVWATQPSSYPAALYGVVSIVASGQLVAYFTQAKRRQQLLNALRVLLLHSRYRLLALAALLSLLLLAPAGWSALLQTWGAKLFSIGIIALMVADLWRQRQRLGLIRTVYFRCGLLTYLRAAGTIAITIAAFLSAYQVFPPFMRWGWSSLIFGQPSNIIFQPFNLFSGGVAGLTYAGAIAEHLVGQVIPWAGLLSKVAIATAIPWAALSITGFWLLLLLGIPFWARLEEHIFRRGANTWKKIAVRSTQFGLVHLLAGIPLLGGVVLILPGFLFACRYKYVCDRHFRRHQNLEQAQEAGVAASTADHAVYNAILVSLVASNLLAVALN
ncbi:MAG: tetratricopeptide repeat protein [Elainellaceae cyanobacterium]